MPKIPTYDNYLVDQSVNPSTRVNTTLTPEMASIPGQQMENMGKAMSSAVSMAASIYTDQLNEANKIRVDDAENKAKEKYLDLLYNKDVGLVNQKGINALERTSGKSLTDEYVENFQSQVDDISKGLGNDVQRRLFKTKADGMAVLFRGNAEKHESQEFTTYALSVKEGSIKTSMNVIGLNYNNPGMVDVEVDNIKRSAAEAGRLNGKSATWIEANTRDLLSKAHKISILSAIEKDDIIGGSNYLNRYKNQMESDDILHVRSVLGKQVDAGTALAAVDKAFDKLSPQIATSDTSRAWNIALGTESNNQQFDKSGKPLTSSKGATGIAQVMPETGKEMAKELGIAWDENRFKNDAAYNEQLGRAYFDKNLKTFGGNLAQTFAAYNAGTQAVLDYRDGTNKSGKNPNKITTPEGIPPFKETQDYVRKNVAAYEAGKGRNTEPTVRDILLSVRENLSDKDGNLNVSPTVLKQAEDDAVIRFSRYKSSQAQRDDETVGSAIRGLVENNGNYMALPGALRANIPPDKVSQVMSFATKVATGTQATNLAVYQKLTDPAYLNGLTDAQFYTLRAELDASDFKRFADIRASVRTGKAMTAAQDVPSGAINEVLNNRLRNLDIDPTPKESDTGKMQQIGAIKKFVRDSVLETQMSLGRKLTDVEVEKKIDDLFAKSVQFKETFAGITYGDVKNMKIMTMKVSDIKDIAPGAVERIKADLKMRGIDNPSDGAVLDVWLKMKMKKNG
ncbi:transglycosylase SLT domain-containing protein [Polynucleobacter sp. UB-Piko-W3]|uniref:transglycosylase SLT domain-containing protein n=1 Tax=Polynucleobacter sp. UB-Piko-W3 TaxID=1819735 RepID=UPI001C0CF8E2|nr:transglycosylase SLT domain-containing protein [Polynucleobacter sp. UB-Piko-W3]MBU3554825.1 transglycosylase SLT domain-containing protein [Polynucleobacter sp. UB-Piko-W3]